MDEVVCINCGDHLLDKMHSNKYSWSHPPLSPSSLFFFIHIKVGHYLFTPFPRHVGLLARFKVSTLARRVTQGWVAKYSVVFSRCIRDANTFEWGQFW